MKKGKIILPKGAWVTVNRNCNFRCKWCYAQDTKYSKHNEMSLSFAKKIISLINTLNIKNITIIGGEPTLWSPLLEFNNFCKNLDIKTSLVTNAMEFSDDHFWGNYIKNPNTRAGISIKAYDLPSLKESCGISNMDKVKLGIQRGTKFFNCGVSFVFNSFLEANIIDTVKFAMDNGASSVSISPCTPVFNKDSVENKYAIDIDAYVYNVVKNYDVLCDITKERLSFSMKIPLCLWPREFIKKVINKKQISSICQIKKRSGIIFDVNGDIFMCNNLFNYPIGVYGKDFLDSESLLDFLNSNVIIDYYEKINSYPSEKCIGCSKYGICAGGCPLMWAVYNPLERIKGWDK